MIQNTTADIGPITTACYTSNERMGATCIRPAIGRLYYLYRLLGQNSRPHKFMRPQAPNTTNQHPHPYLHTRLERIEASILKAVFPSKGM